MFRGVGTGDFFLSFFRKTCQETEAVNKWRNERCSVVDAVREPCVLNLKIKFKNFPGIIPSNRHNLRRGSTQQHQEFKTTICLFAQNKFRHFHWPVAILKNSTLFIFCPRVQNPSRAPGNLAFNILNIDDLSTPETLLFYPLQMYCKCLKNGAAINCKCCIFLSKPNRLFFFLRIHLHKYILPSQPAFLLPRRCPL